MALRENIFQEQLDRGKVAIVMVNYNGRNLLKTAIDSLVDKTTYPNYQLLLVDNGSTDGSVEFIKEVYPWVTLICNLENKGYSKANNQGIRASKADYYLLLNTDIEIYTKGWLTRLVDLLESDRSIGIVTCYQPRSKKAIRERGGLPYEVKSTAGAVFLIKRETINNIGLLDEIFTPCLFEDTDWCTRAVSAGWRILCDPSTVVIHLGELTTKKVFDEVPRYFYINVRNRLFYNIIHHSLIQLPSDFLFELIDLGSALFVGFSEKRLRKLRSLVRAYAEVSHTLKPLFERRRARKMLKAPFLK
jgi:GT2 family glycosyltransferase